MKRITLFLSLLLLTGCALPNARPGLVVSDPWVRAAPSGDNSAAYLTIANTSATPHALVGVSSSVAKQVELHETVVSAGGNAMMQPVAQVPVPARGRAELKQGSYHVMLIGLQQTLKAGDRVDLTLRFASGDTLAVSAEVREAQKMAM